MKRLVFMFVFMMFILAACGNDETIEEEIQVSFDSGGGTVLNPRVVIKNDPPSAFSEPTKEGYNFLGWYVDDEYLEA
uniref:InlB B-repeat-containing protein n=1 Tax=Methanocalculus natronophilus TaxID=1262400 RepID=UPI0031B59CCB